jgi:cyclopropane fatty-acyl-phospholipid synthase-like methyltransferase
MTMSDFDARAATWDDDPAKGERAQAIADAIVRTAPLSDAMRAMEYGCGTGLLSFMLRPRLGAQARGAGFAAVEFVTAQGIEKEVDGRGHRHPVFLTVARKASDGARGGKWPLSKD